MSLVNMVHTGGEYEVKFLDMWNYRFYHLFADVDFRPSVILAGLLLDTLQCTSQMCCKFQ